MRKYILVPNHYDLLASVHSWVYPDIQPVPEITYNQCYSRKITINKMNQIPIKVEQTNPGDSLEVQFPFNSATDSIIEMRIQDIFGLSVPTENALSAIQDDSTLHYLKSLLEGIKPYLTDTLFEALIKSIIQQQISYRVANIITQRLILGLTKPIIYNEQKVYSFPKPETILETNEETMRNFGLGKKNEYIAQIASMIVSGDLDLESLRDSSYEEITEVLKPIKGIGTWTIDAFCIAGLGKFTIFPYGDIGIRNLLAKLYGTGSAFSKSEVIDKSDLWGKSGPMVLYLLMCAEVLGLIK
jgi:DNA-3-methyladenine glycosylase II